MSGRSRTSLSSATFAHPVRHFGSLADAQDTAHRRQWTPQRKFTGGNGLELTRTISARLYMSARSSRCHRDAALTTTSERARCLNARNSIAGAGIGNLVDADLASESARLQSLQIKQQLGVQALSIANAGPASILGLFR